MEGMVEGSNVISIRSNTNYCFWKERRVLLTGHTGFKGTWMSLMLEQLGAKVCGYALPVQADSFYKSVEPNVVQSVEADIGNLKLVTKVFEDFQPEIVFHFAAHSSLQGSMDIPVYILKTNLMGTLNILEASRHNNSVQAIVIVTSDKCYFNRGGQEVYIEDSVLWATDPYSASKVGQELLSACYRDTFFEDRKYPIAIATARASNVVGPGDYNYTRLFPYIFDSFINGRTPEIRNPHAVRPWQYVLDVLYGYLLLAEKLYLNTEGKISYNGAYNFGPAENGFVDVEYVTKVTSQYFDYAPYKVIMGKDHIPNETKILRLDSSKAQDMLGWHPKYTIERALEETASFLKAEKRGQDRYDLARKMVAKYL